MFAFKLFTTSNPPVSGKNHVQQDNIGRLNLRHRKPVPTPSGRTARRTSFPSAEVAYRRPPWNMADCLRNT